MSAPGAHPPGDGGEGAGAQPSEEQLRAAYEEELRRISTTDMIAQMTVSLLNVGASRLAAPAGGEDAPGAPAAGAPAAGRDLEQARDAIDAVRALLEILERRIPQELRPLRDALSRLQMAYARELAPGGSEAASAPARGTAPVAPAPAPGEHAPAGGEEPARGPGPAEASGRLWVPGR